MILFATFSFCHTLLIFCHLYNFGMCSSPHRVFYTGLKTDSGKELLYFDNHYPCPDKISLDLAEKRLKVRIPLNPDFVRCINGHYFLFKSREVPCGKCDSCRLSNAKKWSQRVLMESKYFKDDECHFITLTFMDPFCPKKVCKEDVSSFMKRLRFVTGCDGIKFFACGEYGSQQKRPHYHLIVLGCKLNDLLIADSARMLYESPTLNRIWPFGMVRVGKVTQETCNYVARYTSKKIGDDQGFILMSRRPGLGFRYIKAYGSTLKALDYLPLFYNGVLHRVTPPRYAERVFSDHDFSLAKDLRVSNAERSKALDSLRHGLAGCRLDDYLRGVASANMARIAKKEL